MHYLAVFLRRRKIAIDKTQVTSNNLKAQLSNLEKDISGLETKNKELQIKVDEADPWFKLTDIEKNRSRQKLKPQKINV